MKTLLKIILSLTIATHLMAVPLGELGSGVSAKESASGAGYILFSPVGLTPRFTLPPGQASHFAAVYYQNDTWYYYNNENPVAFVPQATDLLVASLDYSADTATPLSGQNSFTHGIRTGYASGDLGVTANLFAGVGNLGKFTVTGTNIVLNPPQWWVARGVTNANAPNNLAVANLGQAKHMANQAYVELVETYLPGGAGFALDSLFPNPPAVPTPVWYEAQKAPLNLGQLKAVAMPFYEQLNLVSPDWVEQQFHINGLTTLDTHYFKDAVTNHFYPWNPTTPVAENMKLATIGQLKAVFALRFKEDSDEDALPDIWEHHIINASNVDGITSLGHVTPESDFDNDGVDNLTEFQINTDPVVSSYAPIQWVSLRNVSLDTSIPATPSLTKTGGGSFWNAGARSTRVLGGDGSVSASSSDGDSYTMFGLCDIHLNHGYRQIDYAIYFHDGQNIYVHENGANKGLKSTYVPTDVFEIRRTGSTVEYLKNGAVFYTSFKPSTRPFYVVASLNRNNSTLSNTTSEGFTFSLDTDKDGLIDSYEQQIVYADSGDGIHDIADVTGFGDYDQDSLSDAAEYDRQSDPLSTPNQGWIPEVWANHTGTVSSQPSGYFGTSLEKTSVADGYNADATSSSSLLGDGGVSCRVSTLDKRSFIGLNLNDDSASYTDLSYAIFFHTGGAFYVYENGTDKGQKGYYGLNDTFAIERDGDTIYYKRNGKVFYTSAVKTSQPLIIDSSIYNVGNTLTHCLKRGFPHSGDLDGDGINYDAEYALISQVPPSAAESIADISPSTDLDGDGMIDQVEIANGDDPFNIYSGGGNVSWPTDAITAHYRTDQNSITSNTYGITKWANSMEDAYHATQGGTTALPEKVDNLFNGLPGAKFDDNDYMVINSSGQDMFTPDTGFAVMGVFRPTGAGWGVFSNDDYLQSGFRVGVSGNKLKWYSHQYGSQHTLSSQSYITTNTSYQFGLHHGGLNGRSELYLNGSLEASAAGKPFVANTRNPYLNHVNGTARLENEWGELILTNRALTTGEQILLQDYLLAKHQNTGPLAGDVNNNGTPDWQDVDGVGLSGIMSPIDSDGDGTSDADELAAGRNPYVADHPAVGLSVEIILH